MSSKGLEREQRLVFASIVDPNRISSERNALLLVESIRAFAGSLSGAPVWYLTPEHGGQVSDTLRDRLKVLDVTLIPFEMDPEIAAFRFTGEASAAALAESMADRRAECLAWMNTNSLVLREPREFLLPEGKNLAYRPVHHTNIGSRYSENLDHVIEVTNDVCQKFKDDDTWGKNMTSVPEVVRVDSLGDSGIEIKILGDTKPGQQWALMGELRKRLKNRFVQCSGR